MPELPEVETIVRELRQCLVGQTITSVRVRWAGVVALPGPKELAETLVGAGIKSVARRGKYILLRVPSLWLAVHLRMTGRLLYRPDVAPMLETDKHVHAVIEFASGGRLYYRDVRKFGRLWLVKDPQRWLAHLGPEPLSDDFSASQLSLLLQSRRRQLKPALLDQRFLAGLGNIYVDESLWRARLHPLRRTHTLTQEEAVRLHAAIRDVLTDALAHRGTTLRDYRTPDGHEGAHQYTLAVYGQQGEPCSRCGNAVERMVVGQRGTHVCPYCQPAPEIVTTIAQEAGDGSIRD